MAALEAARDLLVELGYEALSIEAIATRAGIGKQTIYRWWRSKAAIIVEAVLEGIIDPPGSVIIDTGHLRADLERWLDSVVAALARPGGEALLRALAVAGASDPAATRALTEGLSGAEQEALLNRLRAGRQAGQIRADVDLKTTADTLTGAVVVTVLSRAPLTTERARKVLDVVLNGIESKPTDLTGSDRGLDSHPDARL
ncbi:TetR/AcrR family transcriptional regulator [Actinomadura napierensis]|uniref:TetR/AcrR family transcriptional regulator n=1 Tax=Actinomadura napierensis TaxID=267854 RepID=A0ABN3AAI1_9ACTN